MKSYLCAKGHHFHAPTPICLTGDCTAEVRPTAVHPLHGRAPAFDKLPRLPEDQRPPTTPTPGPAPEKAAEGATKHSIRWHAYVDGTRTRRSSSMRDADYAWDATCSCGWDSATGGQPMGDVDKLAQAHKVGVL